MAIFRATSAGTLPAMTAFHSPDKSRAADYKIPCLAIERCLFPGNHIK